MLRTIVLTRTTVDITLDTVSYPRSNRLILSWRYDLHAEVMATDEDIETLSMLGGYLIFSILDRRPLPKFLTLIDAGAPLWYQDEDGTSALHAAAYIEDEKLVRILIEKGAIWNAGEGVGAQNLQSRSCSPFLTVDNLRNTAADIALSMNNESCYRMIRDAGIRSGESTCAIILGPPQSRSFRDVAGFDHI